MLPPTFNASPLRGNEEEPTAEARALIDAWRGVVERELMPLVRRCGEPLEGSIFCRCRGDRYDASFLAKQNNMIAFALAAAAGAPRDGPAALEVGFNAGFSALLLLMACPRLTLTCVDIASHAYTRPCAEWLAARFPGRVRAIFGDSTRVLPQLAALGGAGRYDLVHVDGCHDPEIAARDVANAAALVAPGGLVIMDDTDADFIRRLWTEGADARALLPCAPPPPGTMRTDAHDLRRAALLAYYTVFCGPAGHVADVVPRPPSSRHPCYYYSNCGPTLERAARAGWIAVDVAAECPPSADDVVSATQAKPFKAAPHRRPELARYDYTVYIDTKRAVDDAGAAAALAALTVAGKALLVKAHPSRDAGVHVEVQRALTLERYARQADLMIPYVNQQLGGGGGSGGGGAALSNDRGNVWTTLVVRAMRHPRCAEVGETWMEHIGRCGIECQVSFFFIQQLYEDAVLVDATDRTPVVDVAPS